MATIHTRDIIAEVMNVAARRSVTDFFDAAVSLHNSPTAPKEPYLVHLAQEKLVAAKTIQRKAKVVFEDDIKEAPSVSADESLQQIKDSTRRKALLIQEALGVSIATAQDVHDYFAAKSLVEWLPPQCFIPTVEDDFYSSSAFKNTRSLEASSAVQEQLSALSDAGAGFATKTSRTKLCLRRPDCLYHWGCRHAFQLFLRAALQRREPDAQCETKAGRLLVELSTAGLPLLPTPNSAAACRETVLAAVMERTQLEHQTIPLLHLQCRALLKDKKLLRDPTLLESDEGTSRGGSLSRSLSIAGSEDSNTLTRPSSSNSDTKSAVSISGSRKLPKLQHISLNDKLEYWIALKGLVFRISFDKCPAGRSAYYRAVLVPIFSGRECTFPFLALSVNFNPWDFLNAKERALTMQRSGSTSAPCKRVLAAAGIVSEEQSLDMLLSKEQKIHIDRIFALFLADFDLIGELEGYSHYWF